MKLIKISIILTLILAQSLFGATYYVDAVNGSDSASGSSGAPWKTTAKVQAVVAAGDTVKFRTGNYGSLNLSLSSPAGTSWSAPITYIADTSHTPVFNWIGMTTNNNVTRDWYVIFNGITVDAPTASPGQSGNYGSKVTNGSCIKFLNCTFTGTVTKYSAVMAIKGLYISSTYNVAYPAYHDVTVENCIFTGLRSGLGVDGWVGDNVVISNNTFYGNSANGIDNSYFWAKTPGTVLLTNNKIHGQIPGILRLWIYGGTKGPSYTIKSISRSNNVVTVTTTTAHAIKVGHEVDISGVTDSSFNGVFKLTGGSSNTFTYAQTASDTTSSGGTALMRFDDKEQLTQDNNPEAMGYKADQSQPDFFDVSVTANHDWDVGPDSTIRGKVTGAYVTGGTHIEVGEYEHSTGIAARGGYFIARNNIIHDIGGTNPICLFAVEGQPGGWSNILIENNLIYDSYNITCLKMLAVGTNVVVRNNTLIGQHRGPEKGTGWYNAPVNIQYYPGVLSGATLANNIIVGYVSIPSAEGVLMKNNILYAAKPHTGTWLTQDQINISPSSGNIIVETLATRTSALPYFEGSNNFFVGGTSFDTYSYTFPNNSTHRFDLGNSYALTATSPAVGYANPTYAPSTDILGRARGSQPDAGCYEYISGASDPPPVNHAPVLTAIGSKSVNAGSTLTFVLTATDADNDSLTYSSGTLPSGASFNAGTRTFTWTPAAGLEGTYQAAFTVSDGKDTDSETITITVHSVNSAPVLAAIGNKTVNENVQMSFTVTASDADGDTLTYSAANLPSGATFANRVFTWTPNYNQSGSYSVTITVSDGVLSDSETITITVNNTNQPPILAAIGNKTVKEGTALSFSITAADPEGSAITYQAANLPSGATFTGQSFTWTPNYSQAGTYSVTFSANDGAASDTEMITITVTNTNRAPVLNAIGNKNVNEGQSLSFTISATDGDSQTLTYSAQNLPAGATFANRVFSWTPTFLQAGSYSVTLLVTDGTLTDSETVTITVANVTAPPVLAAIGNKTVAEGATLSFSITATDPEGTGITYQAANLPSGAIFTGQSFTWTPNYSQAGTYSVTFTASDGSASDSETITITVTGVNMAPVVADIPDKTAYKAIEFSLTIDANDPDNDEMTYSASGLPAGASFTPATRTFTWTPSASQVRTDPYEATFAVSDGKLSVSKKVVIKVENNMVMAKMGKFLHNWVPK